MLTPIPTFVGGLFASEVRIGKNGILGIDSSRDRICAYPVNPVHPVLGLSDNC